MRPIDFHTHAYPDRIAEKAAQSIGAFYDIPVRYDGRISTLLDLGTRYAIGRFVIHSVATAPSQVESINTYIARTAEAHSGRLIGFAAMHPDYADIGKEIGRAVSLGLRGVKIHPDFQRFYVDGPGACRIFEAAEGRLPVLVHTGDIRYGYSKAERVAAVLKRFPMLTLIGAHFGGWSEWDHAVRVLAGSRIYVDTSSSLYAMSPERARQLVSLFGADRVLFGSDYPMWDPGEELERIGRIGLTPDEYAKVTRLNAEKLLHI